MLRRLFTSHPRRLAASGVALLLALLSLWLLDSRLVPASYDAMYHAAGASGAPLTNPPVVLVYLDLDSHLREQQRLDAPWSRALHAKLLRRLQRAGAGAVVFDITFSEPGPDAQADADFAAAIHEQGRVVLAVELDQASRATGDEPGTRTWTPVLPLETFRRAAAAWGLAALAVDEDFVTRRMFGGRLSQHQPSLAWATAQVLDVPATRYTHLLPQTAWLRYYGGPLTLPHVSYSDALAPAAVPDDFFRGKVVVIGARPIAGLFRERHDEFRSPWPAGTARDLFMPAVEIHATQMLNLIRHDWLKRLPPAFEGWLLILGSVLCPAVLFQFRPLPATVLAALAEAGVLALAGIAFSGHGIWFPWLIVAVVQLPVALGGSTLFHTLEWARTRRRLEAGRRADEARIRNQAALLDKAQDAILVRDLAGRVRYANPGAARLYGWSVTELREEGVVEKCFAPAAQKVSEARRQVLERGEWLGELEQTTRSGTALMVESRWTLIRDAGGAPESVLLINTDVTEKKRLEAQFLRTQRLETIGALAGGMAHDLNNALSPILMGVQLLRKKPHDEESGRMLTVMETNTHRGADLVRQVLTFSRGREGEMALVEVGRVVRELEEIIRQTLPKSIRVAAMVPADLWPVMGNATQLHQVLLNLCVNARDAMPGGGDLTLAADNVDLAADETAGIPGAVPGQFVMLLVADTGSGIPPALLPLIFEPFFTTKPADQGTGLGLSTTARIVRAHGGFVKVRSEAGAGTTFEVYLPRAVAVVEAPATAAPAAEPPRGQGELVLLVDDEFSIHELVAPALVEQGYRVLTAASGGAALALLDEHREEIRLVLLDLGLPLQEVVRQRSEGRPVVLMTGAASLSPSGMPVLLKPFRLEELLLVVGRQLGGH